MIHYDSFPLKPFHCNRSHDNVPYQNEINCNQMFLYLKRRLFFLPRSFLFQYVQNVCMIVIMYLDHCWICWYVPGINLQDNSIHAIILSLWKMKANLCSNWKQIRLWNIFVACMCIRSARHIDEERESLCQRQYFYAFTFS